MPARAPLPPELPTAFTTAEAAALGVPRHRLRAGDLHVTAHGARRVGPPADLRERAAALTPVLPRGAAFFGPTAARLHGLWLPGGPRPDEPLHVMSSDPTDRVRRPEVIWHKGGRRRQVVEVRGLRLAAAVDAWADLAPYLSLPDLVAAGDSLWPWRPDPRAWDERRAGPPTRPRVQPVLEARLWTRRPGRARALEAAAQVRPGSASRPESLLRLWLIGAGMPEPQLNVDVWSRRGRWLGVFDLVWPELRLIGEYDGDHHRTDADQWHRDRRRLADVRSEHWTVLQVDSRDLFVDTDATIRRFLAAAWAA